MICSHCGRAITKPAATVRKAWSGLDEHYGPRCALKLGLVNPAVKAKKAKMTRTRNTKRLAFWAAQQDLFLIPPDSRGLES